MAKETSKGEMTLIDHIRDLRTCLIRCSAILVVSTLICFYFSEHIFNFLWEPYAQVVNSTDTKINYNNIFDSFTFSINLSVISGVLIALPFLLYEIFKFIAPGLKKNEINFFRVYSIIGSILFLAGTYLGYNYMLPRLAQFMIDFRQEGTVTLLDSQEFLKTTVKIILGIGIIFQFPLVLFFLVKIGLIETKTLTQNRKIIFVIILIISAFVTPPDPLSMVIIATPFYCLFEISILACKKFIKES